MGRPAPKRLPGVKGNLILALGILCLVAGGAMFLFQLDQAGSRELWILGGAALGIGGIAALVYYYDRFGKL